MNKNGIALAPWAIRGLIGIFMECNDNFTR
jgi:hypothetical protein